MSEVPPQTVHSHCQSWERSVQSLEMYVYACALGFAVYDLEACLWRYTVVVGLLCSTSPAGHWHLGTQGLKQCLSITPSGTSPLTHVTGHGGTHTSNTKPRSAGQPTARERERERETGRGKGGGYTWRERLCQHRQML